MSTCAYGTLAAGMAVLSGTPGDERLPQPPCSDPAAFYSKVVQEVASGYEVEHNAKVCIEHQGVINEMSGHWQSIRIRIS